MNISHNQLKDAYRGYVRDRIPDSRSSCPDPRKLFRFFSSRSSRKSKTKILDHVARCGLCAKEFEMFMEIDREAKEFTRSLERFFSRRGPVKSRLIHPGFLPTWEFTLIGVGLVFMVLSMITTIPRMTRPSENAFPIRASETHSVRLIRPIGLIPSSRDIEFIWKIDFPSEYSIFELYDDSLELLWKSPPVKTHSCFLPPAPAALIRPGRKYFWMVRVLSRYFQPLESDLKEFSVIRD